MNKLLTIAIPFYNAERFLELAIKSVLAQTYKDWHLLLIDDGSTDSSLSIAKKYEKDPRIEIHNDGKNLGLVSRLNQIAQLSQTKYLARMDADDIMHPERIEKQLNTLLKHPDIDVLGTNMYSIDEYNQINGIRNKYDLPYGLLKVSSFSHPTIIALTEWFRHNPYDSKAVRIEDSELWIRTSYNSNFQILTEPLFFYREFGGEYFKKYFKQYESFLYLQRKYKNKKYLLKGIASILKGFIYQLFNLINKEDYLIRRRNKGKTTDTQKKEGDIIINEIIKYKY